MRLFKKKSPSEVEATAAAAPTEEAHDLKPSRFSFRRNSNANEVTTNNNNTNNVDNDGNDSSTNYNAMEENVAEIELPQKSQDDASSSSVATEAFIPEMRWCDFICLWGWCAVPCVAYILLFTVSFEAYILICYLNTLMFTSCVHL